MNKRLTHTDKSGKAAMVDVSDKPTSERVARAEGRIYMEGETLRLIEENAMAKGDVLGVARLAGIMAGKRTSDLIPLCHPLNLSKIDVACVPDVEGASVLVTSEVKVTGQTGVEMEALTAVSVACLTIYDMCKAVDRSMRIGDIFLVHKSGGRSGTYDAES